MANLGAYSPTLRADALYSPEIVPQGWYYGPLPDLFNPLIAAETANVTIPIDTAGALTWTGQTVGVLAPVTIPITTAGAVTWTGQTVNIVNSGSGAVTVPITTPGALTWTGQTVGVLSPVVVAITAGAVTWQGQTVLISNSGDAPPPTGPVDVDAISGPVRVG